ncbi:MAG: DUF6159 family protein [Gaiellaceae bacterium]
MTRSMRLGDGARLMRASWDVVRDTPALLWFPLVSTLCLVLVTLFWLFEGAWLYAVSGPWELFVPLVLIGVYSLTFVGIFFNVALAGAADGALEGQRLSFEEALSLAWSRFGPIAGWAAWSLTVSLLLGAVESFRGLKWVGRAAQVAWSFATFFVIPLIAVEGIPAGEARRQSMSLAKAEWQEEAGGLGALRLALLVPGFLFYLAVRLLAGGHAHSPAVKTTLVLVLLCGFALSMGVSTIRQVFAVSLYRRAPAGAASLAA